MDLSYSFKSSFDPSQLRVLLESAELHTGVGGGRFEQQLTVPGAFIVPIAGRGFLHRNKERVQLERGYLYTCQPGSTFGLEANTSGEWSVVVIRLQLAYGTDASRDLEDELLFAKLYANLDGLTLTGQGKLASICRSIYENFSSGDAMKVWRARLDSNDLLYQLLSDGRRTAREDTRHALERAKAFMDDCYYEEVTIDRLADLAGLSPKYFVDVFKKTYGVSAMDYLTEVRMRRAKTVMLRSDRLLRDIAHEVGYEDEFYFSRKFKQVVGLSPTAYRKKRGKKVAAYGSSALIGYLLPLGVIPYAAPLHPKWSKSYQERYGADIPVHLNAYRQNFYKESNLEMLERSKPELIVCEHGLEQWEMERLSAIATIVELPKDGLGWRHKLSSLAAALEAKPEEKHWLKRFEEKREEVRRSLYSFEAISPKRVLTLKFFKGDIFLYGSSSLYDPLFMELELSPAAAELKPGCNRRISTEELGELDAEHVLLLVCQESETLKSWEELRISTAWMSLPFVRDNRLQLISSEPWREYSPDAIRRTLDEAAALLTGNRP